MQGPPTLLLLLTGGAAASPCPWEDSSLARWSHPSTWGDQGVPGDGQQVDLEVAVLLDTVSARLDTLTIRDGGSVVFSPEVEVARLTAGVVKVQGNGSLLIGGPDCRFPGRAEVVLVGDDGADTTMGAYTKGIYVEEGGTLDIHGEEKLPWTRLTATLLPQVGAFNITLAEEPVGWRLGDKLVIASTDYNMWQAEVVEVVECPPCHHHLSCTCTVMGEVKFMHYGQLYKGLDMRAEVGLLSRNVHISGETKDEEDRFGGHIKALRGFQDFRIRGAELTRMGQYGYKGRYPIHWHMAHSVEDKDTYVMENSIHDVFQRCVTVHGTHGARVERNVAYNTFGHCYFLEDGGERNTTMVGNLGLMTKAGITIPSDRKPATFWITSPLTVMVGNAAGGSAGVGIWYIFAPEVTGPSADQGFFQPGEAFRTRILAMADNTAHSNGNRGFFFGDELTMDQDFADKETRLCHPYEDPLDPYSPPTTHLVERLTVYKNYERGVWNDCKNITFDGLKVADAPISFTSTHTPCNVRNSLFIGESGNLGEPNEVRLRDGTRVMWHRSTPHGLHYQATVRGINFYDGYVEAEHNTFTDFYDDEYKLAGAISFKAVRNIKATFRDTFFDFEDGVGGNYVKGVPKYSYGAKNGERRGLVHDLDGTITGVPGSTIVPDRPFYRSGLCQARPHWGNMTVCPHTYLSLVANQGYNQGDFLVTRDDVGEEDICMSGGDSPCHYMVMAMSGDHSHIIAPAAYFWDHLSTTISGIPEGDFFRMGFCFPLNSTITVSGSYDPVEVATMEELMADTTGAAFFKDDEVGVVFRRFKGDEWGTHHFTMVVEELGSEDVDCISRAYPKYTTEPI